MPGTEPRDRRGQPTERRSRPSELTPRPWERRCRAHPDPLASRSAGLARAARSRHWCLLLLARPLASPTRPRRTSWAFGQTLVAAPRRLGRLTSALRRNLGGKIALRSLAGCLRGVDMAHLEAEEVFGFLERRPQAARRRRVGEARGRASAKWHPYHAKRPGPGQPTAGRVAYGRFEILVPWRTPIAAGSCRQGLALWCRSRF